MCVGEAPTLSVDTIKQLKVCDVNAVLLMELKKLREQLTPETAMRMVGESLDQRIAVLENDVHAPLPLEAVHIMAW